MEHEKHETKNKNNWINKQPKIKASLVWKRGCWESLLERNNQTLTEEKAKKERQKKPLQNIFSKKGLMDKKHRKKMEFERDDKRKTRKNAEQEEEKDFKERAFGGTKEEKHLKLQEDSLLGAFC